MAAPLDDLFDWLLDGAPGAKLAIEIADRLGTDFAAAGIPIDRLSVMVLTLHPNVMGRAFVWERGKPTRIGELTEAMKRSRDYQHSPPAWVAQHGTEWRWRPGEPDHGFEVVAGLAARGCVDYLCMPLRFTDGSTQAVAVSSNVGFTDEHIGDMRRIMRPLARIAEIFALRRTATNILSTYVGASSGERVMRGQILRGDVDVIRAAIWFSDLRGFTERSSRMTPHQVIAMLNDVFECQVPAIEQHGGEVLKFIGDGLLAIFPITEARPARTGCGHALDAAAAAFTALTALNARAGSELRIGLALHVGDVAYGNIGGPSRLDFTAIGAAVNFAARLEGVAGKLGRDLVVSEDFARAAERSFEDLGAFELKGIATPQHVYA